MTSNINGHDRLSVFIEQQRHYKLQLGQHDCGLFLADWLEVLSGRHPCPDVRGSYNDYDGLNVVMNGKTLRHFVGDIARGAGCIKTKTPHRNDIGVFLSGYEVMLGICAGSSWFTRKSGIAVFKNVKVITAWSINS